ncbi:MAG: GAF domain-containing protein [Chloroflexi bacterium]|nr:GAF domain-containing protein [Chloroflexota bacterium]
MPQEKILIVEDEKDLYVLMDTMMQSNGYRTVIARDGVEGLDLALRERPDLILLDLQLPKMDGMQVLRDLREQQVNLPVVLVTAWRTERLVLEALRLGVKDYITKPFTMQEMLDVVHRALTEGRLRRERDTLIDQLQGSNQELAQRVAQITALYEVGQALASTLDLDETLDVILREAGRVLGVDVASILLLDERTGELVFCSGTGDEAQVLIDQRLSSGHGIAGWVAEHGDPLLVQDVLSDPRHSATFDNMTGFVTDSILCVPLIVKGRVIGVVEALNKPEPGFTQDDLAMLRSLATSAAIAIENAQLFEETHRLHHQTQVQLTRTEQAYGEIQALQETTGALLSSSLDLPEVLNQIVNSVVSGLGYNGAILAEYNEQDQSLPVRAFAADPILTDLIESYEKQVGFRLVDTHVTMDQTENLAVSAALDGKIQVTSNLFDLFQPWVTLEMAEAMQVAAGIRTLATIPLLTKDRLVGNLFAASGKNQLAESDLDSLQTLANQAALAIENAQLYQNLRESRDQVTERSEALEKRLSELSRLQQMAMELGRVTIGANPQDIFEQLTEQAATLLEAKSSAIMLFDPERGKLVCQEPAFGVPSEIVRDWRISLSKDNPSWAIWESGGPFILNDVADAPIVKMMGFGDIQERMGLRSTIFCWLRIGGRPVGALQVSDKRDDSDFTPDDARVLQIFASQSAISIENARILQRMEALNQVGEAITARLTLSEVLERVIQGVDELIRVQGISIWLKESSPDGAGAKLSLVVSLPDKSLPDKLSDVGLEMGEGIAGMVAQTGRSLIVHDAQNDPRYSRQFEQRTGLMAESLLCVPLQVGDAVSGVVEVVNKIGSEFDQEDLEIISSVAASLAVAVENARLFTSEKRRASEMEALVEIAQAITEAVTEHPKALLERIARGACEALEADCAIVYPFVASEADIYDMDNVATFGTHHPLKLAQSHMPVDDPTRVIRKRKLLVCGGVVCDQQALLQAPFFEREDIQSFVGVLLEADKDEMGVLYINFRTLHHFEEHELAFVRLIAHQAALAIAKSRLFQTLDRELVQANANLRRKVRELEELQAINNVISSTLEIDKVWDSILHGAMSITAAPHAAVLLIDEESGKVFSRMRRGDETSIQWLDPNETLILPSAKEIEERFARHQDVFQSFAGQSAGGIPWGLTYWRLAPDAHSVLHTPIVSGDDQEPKGFLVIGSSRQEEFGPDDRRLLEALANQAVIAIQNAQYLETLRTYQEQQVEAERIAAMADIAGNMVHRINNTVGAIRPLTQQVKMKLDRGALTDEYLDDKLQKILENADRTLKVARHIRRPFRAIQLERINVNESIAAAEAELTTPVGVEMDVEYGINLSLVEATEQLDEVFRNLMKNAMDAMAKEGGYLLVRSRQIENRMVIVTVADNGPGIPPQIRDNLFHMGATTKQGGMGYGLWWSKTFLRRLGGDVVLESEEGKGCTFTVTLPISEPEGGL